MLALTKYAYAVQAADCMQLLTSVRLSDVCAANSLQVERTVRDASDGTTLCMTRESVV